jgi:hypothetical protein
LKQAKWVVLLDRKITPAKWLARVKDQPEKKQSFTKRCENRECGRKNVLAAKACERCGEPFPEPTKKVNRVAG